MLSRAAPYNNDRIDAGFTIIEVLVALAVVAISLAAIGSLVATTMRGVSAIERHVALAAMAREVVATIALHAHAPKGMISGETSGYRWRIVASPWFGGGLVGTTDSPWIPQWVRIRVLSPSGTAFDIETVRLQKRPNG
jgi:general secretion pathway protein I